MKVIQFSEEEFTLVASLLAGMKEQLILQSASKPMTKDEEKSFSVLQSVCKKFARAIKSK